MAARLRKTHQEDIKTNCGPWRWYVYKFFLNDLCVYVGKGCGKRFDSQKRRFAGFSGVKVASFKLEADALAFEKAQIVELAPQFNKIHMPAKPSPWKYRLLPEDKDFYSWCDAIGTRAMAARVLLSKPWSFLEEKGLNINRLINKVGPFNGVYYGACA